MIRKDLAKKWILTLLVSLALASAPSAAYAKEAEIYEVEGPEAAAGEEAADETENGTDTKNGNDAEKEDEDPENVQPDMQQGKVSEESVVTEDPEKPEEPEGEKGSPEEEDTDAAETPKKESDEEKKDVTDITADTPADITSEESPAAPEKETAEKENVKLPDGAFAAEKTETAVPHRWQKEDGGIAYYDENGIRISVGSLSADGNTFEFNEDGFLSFCRVEDSSSVPPSYNGKAVVGDNEYIFSDGVPLTGWYEENGKVFYLSPQGCVTYGMTETDKGTYLFDKEDGHMLSGSFAEYDGRTYYAKEDGTLAKGLAVIEGKTYLFEEDGAMLTGWQDRAGNRYYLSPETGRALTGWQDIGGKRYYFDKNGKMLTGWQQISGKTYYLAKEGASAGLTKIGNSTYYFLNDGSAANGIVKIDGKGILYFENGLQVKKTGWVKYNGRTYYFGTGGAAGTGWRTVGGKRYYFDGSGAMKTGWLTVGKKKYYMNADGAMRTGWLRSGGKMYFFDDSGAAKTGWLKRGKKFFYFNADGSMKTGWLSYGGKRYYINSDGTRRTGWLRTNGKLYFLNADGVMQKGWLTRGKKKFYLGTDGAVRKGFVNIGSGKYYFNENGVMRTGWMLSGGKMRFFDSNGKMHTGWLKRGNKKFYFDKNGIMQKGLKIIGKNIYYFSSKGIMNASYTRNASQFLKLSASNRKLALKIINTMITSRKSCVVSERVDYKKEYSPVRKAIEDTYFPYCGTLFIEYMALRSGNAKDDGKGKLCMSSYYSENNISYMKKNAEIEKLLTRKLSAATSANRSAWDKAEDIAEYICDTFRYDYDAYYNDTGTWDTHSTIKAGKGICFNYSEYYYWLCEKAGIPCRIIFGKAGGGEHAWNQVKLGRNWYNIDVCWMDGSGYRDWDYFLSRNLWGDHRFGGINRDTKY